MLLDEIRLEHLDAEWSLEGDRPEASPEHLTFRWWATQMGVAWPDVADRNAEVCRAMLEHVGSPSERAPERAVHLLIQFR